MSFFGFLVKLLVTVCAFDSLISAEKCGSSLAYECFDHVVCECDIKSANHDCFLMYGDETQEYIRKLQQDCNVTSGEADKFLTTICQADQNDRKCCFQYYHTKVLEYKDSTSGEERKKYLEARDCYDSLNEKCSKNLDTCEKKYYSEE